MYGKMLYVKHHQYIHQLSVLVLSHYEEIQMFHFETEVASHIFVLGLMIHVGSISGEDTDVTPSPTINLVNSMQTFFENKTT